MKALSIRQPWAWLILHGGKDVENRRWRTAFRGRVLIHAAKGMTLYEYNVAYTFTMFRTIAVAQMPWPKQLQRGGIIGSVEIVDCVTESDSPWFAGPFGFVLRDPQPLPFRACRGALRFFDVEQ